MANQEISVKSTYQELLASKNVQPKNREDETYLPLEEQPFCYKAMELVCAKAKSIEIAFDPTFKSYQMGMPPGVEETITDIQEKIDCANSEKHGLHILEREVRKVLKLIHGVYPQMLYSLIQGGEYTQQYSERIKVLLIFENLNKDNGGGNYFHPFDKEGWANNLLDWLCNFTDAYYHQNGDGKAMRHFLNAMTEEWRNGALDNAIKNSISDYLNDDNVAECEDNPQENCLPSSMLPSDKVISFVCWLKEDGFIESSSNEDDWLILFGHGATKRLDKKIKWLKTKSNLIKLFSGIYDMWDNKDKCPKNSVLRTIQKNIVDQQGKMYKSMKNKEEFSTADDKIDNILKNLATPDK